MRTANRFVSMAFVLIVVRSVNGDKSNDKSNNGSKPYNYNRFSLDMLELHNNYRKLHDSQPLYLNTVLADYAEEVMAKFIIKKQIKLKNVGINTYVSENADSSLPVLNAGMVFMHWYDEMLKYDFTDEPTDFRVTEHFTQIVWKETTAIGVAVRNYGPRTAVVVAYFPRGNIPEQFRKNVSLTV